MYDEVVTAYDQEIEFVTGFAGCGKSTLLAKDTGIDTIVLTPTHASASVLQDKGIKQVFTIYSVLKLVPTINENFRKGQKLQSLKKIGDVDLKEISLIVIDEFSMIPVKVMDMLLELLPGTAKVKIYGDPYHLPPVDGERVFPEDYATSINNLTTQYRSKAPRATETFMRFVHYLDGTGQMDLRVEPIKGTDLCTVDDWAKEFNPETDRILAYTNDKVLKLNDMVAKARGLPKKIMPGENIFMNDIDSSLGGSGGIVIYPTCISKGKIMEGDKLAEVAQHTLNDILKYKTSLSDYELVKVKVQGMEYNCYADYDHYSRSKTLKKQVELCQEDIHNRHTIPEDLSMAQWCRMNKDEEGVRDRAKAWSRYLAHQNLVFNIRRPFATTVYKAQGREFSNVFISLDNIKLLAKGRYPNYDAYARSMYVALSRAINRVVII